MFSLFWHFYVNVLLFEQDLNNFFNDLLKDIHCQDITKAYLINLYTTFKSNNFDLSQENLGLMFLQAKQDNTFADFQQIGDYIFFVQTMMPNYLIPPTYYQDIAR